MSLANCLTAPSILIAFALLWSSVNLRLAFVIFSCIAHLRSSFVSLRWHLLLILRHRLSRCNFQDLNSSSSTTNSSSSYTSLTIQNVDNMVPVKLKRSNYLPWQALFTPIVRWNKLLGIIEGTNVCPPPFLFDRSLNPAFEIWYEKALALSASTK